MSALSLPPADSALASLEKAGPECSWSHEVVRATEAEQERTAQMLHDTICQSLGGIQLLALGMTRQAGETSPQLKANLVELGEVIDRAMEEVREVGKALRPVTLEGGDLREGLRALAAEAARRVPCAFRETKWPAPEPGVAHQLYAIARQFVESVCRGAGADRMSICLGAREGGLFLEVQLIGQKRWTGPRLQQMIGWELLQHRARTIGADLALQLPSGGGASLECQCPSAP